MTAEDQFINRRRTGRRTRCLYQIHFLRENSSRISSSWASGRKSWGRNGVPSRWFHKGRPLAVSDSHHQWTHLSLVATGGSGQFLSVIKCSVLVCYFYAKCFIVVLLMCLLFATGVLCVWIGGRINRVVLDLGCVDIGIDIEDKRWQCHILVLSSFIQVGNATFDEVLMLKMMPLVFRDIVLL